MLFERLLIFNTHLVETPWYRSSIHHIEREENNWRIQEEGCCTFRWFCSHFDGVSRSDMPQLHVAEIYVVPDTLLLLLMLLWYSRLALCGRGRKEQKSQEGPTASEPFKTVLTPSVRKIPYGSKGSQRGSTYCTLFTFPDGE